MKLSIAAIAFFVTGLAFAGPLNVQHDIYACVKKPIHGYPTSWTLVMLKKSEGVVVYQSSSNGNETNEIEDIGTIGSKVIVQHNGGTRETVTFDLRKGNATWVEDAYPENTQVYADCQSFLKYDFNTIRAWFQSVVETQEWRTRVVYR